MEQFSRSLTIRGTLTGHENAKIVAAKPPLAAPLPHALGDSVQINICVWLPRRALRTTLCRSPKLNSGEQPPVSKAYPNLLNTEHEITVMWSSEIGYCTP